MEVFYRAYVIYANLCSSEQRLTHTSAFIALDPSEKGAISYAVGMSMAKVFAEIQLGVAWVMHVDAYRRRYSLNIPTKSRPDLFGHNEEGEWVSIEVKGLSSAVRSDSMEVAKEQARKLVGVAGKATSVCVAVASHFPGDLLQLRVEDPPPLGKGGFSLSVERREFLSDYYRPFVSLLQDGSTSTILSRNGRRYRVIDVPEMDLVLGLNEKVFDASVEGEYSYVSAVDGEGFSAGLDGVFVELGEAWSPENMRLEPEMRKTQDILKKCRRHF